MIRSIAFVSAVLVGIALWCTVANADQREVRRARRRALQSPPAARALDRQESIPVRQAPPSARWRDIYPQFYGGFHYRHIYEFGPPGDFGFRGSPW